MAEELPDPIVSPAAADATPFGPLPLGWPLVERRHVRATPPDGHERRHGDQPVSHRPRISLLRSAPIRSARVVALAVTTVRATVAGNWTDWRVPVCTGFLVAYTVLAVVKGPRPFDRRPTTSWLVADPVVAISSILVTGSWNSPFVAQLVPPVLFAGVAAGAAVAAAESVLACAVISILDLTDADPAEQWRVAAGWAALLLIVALTSGLVHLSRADAIRQQALASTRVDELTEANSLLHALARVAQALPASLDLDELLDTTMARIRGLVPHDVAVVYLTAHDPAAVDPTEIDTPRLMPVRHRGVPRPGAIGLDQLPLPQPGEPGPELTHAVDLSSRGGGLSPASQSGIYLPLTARHTLVGVVALERTTSAPFTAQDVQVARGIATPFGVAIDNALLFRNIRARGAEDERSRIAREIHDRFGSSLAMIGFEIDRAIAAAREQPSLVGELERLRREVSRALADVRNTLFDLRTDVSDMRDLRGTIEVFLEQVSQRSGVTTSTDLSRCPSLPTAVERELWQIVKEAIVNAERHARASTITVTSRTRAGQVVFTVADDGVGFDSSHPRVLGFGLDGMSERAQRLGGSLTLRSHPGTGTEVEATVPLAQEQR